MNRRQSVALIVIGLLCWPLAAATQSVFLAAVGLLLAVLGWIGGGGLRREVESLRPRQSSSSSSPASDGRGSGTHAQ